MQRKHPELTMIFQQTVTTPLKLCLSPGVHPSEETSSQIHNEVKPPFAMLKY